MDFAMRYDGRLVTVNDWKNPAKTKSGRVYSYKTKDYKEFQANFGMAAAKMKKILKAETIKSIFDLQMTIYAPYGMDTDGALKPILDSLEHWLIIENDKNLRNTLIWREYSADQAIEIIITDTKISPIGLPGPRRMTKFCQKTN